MSRDVAMRPSLYGASASFCSSATVRPLAAACCAISESQRSVLVAAGDTAVTRIFDGAPRSARPLVKFVSAALAAPPVRYVGAGLRAAAPVTLQMRPPPCACISGNTARAIRM